MQDERLTTPQKNIWNLQKYYADTAIANQCGAIFYKEKRNLERLKEAIHMIIRKQSGLRLQFTEEDGEVRQYVAEEKGDDIPDLHFADEAELDAYAAEFAKEPMPLTGQPMYRFMVFSAGETSGVLVTLSHLISDAWTFGILAREVDKAYRMLSGEAGEEPVESDYMEYAASEHHYFTSEKYIKDMRFWKEKYTKRPEETPVKIAASTTKSVEAQRLVKLFPMELEEKIKEFCAAQTITPAVLFETALMTYLYRINPELNSVTIGIPVLNRGNAKEKQTAGMFISTMPLTVNVDKGMSAGSFARKITQGHMELFRHQKYPYSEILKMLREKQNFSGNLYDVMFSYQNAATDLEAETRWYSNGYSEVPFTMHIDNRDGRENHTVTVDYQTAIFPREEEVELLIARLWNVLEQICENPEIMIDDIVIIPEKEKQLLIETFNDTFVDYPREKCVHELFTEQAEKTPDRVALVFENKKFTYKELDEMSNSLAHFLREKGVQPNDVVPIIAHRSWHYVVATIAILKSGGAFMPISPDYPINRIQNMLKDINSGIILKHKYADDVEAGFRIVIDLEEVDYKFDISHVDNRNHFNDRCYVLYTSGTTGTPKGVIITHENLTNFINNNKKNEYQALVSNTSRSFLANIEFIFDPHVFQIYLPLANGLKIVLTPDGATGDRIAQIIESNACDAMNCTPTQIALYLQSNKFRENLSQIKVISLGAEVFTEELEKKILNNTKANLYNVYGPTETTIISCSIKIAGGKSKLTKAKNDITIGKPIANTQIYILDKNNRPLPIGVAGELCIAGAGVGKGYMNRPELTAEKFVPNPFATEQNHHGEILYHTGDLARWRVDGEIEYLGRIDTQVKIRGLRIELGEIESIMSSFAGIRLTAVADKRDENGRQYLVGYYTTADGNPVDEKELRRHLSAKLPKYMIPNYFMHLEQMPMTPSGKTARKNLPVPEFTAETDSYVAPETEAEKKLAVIWQNLLQIERVGKKDDFFELGGDSLLAISMVNEIAGAFHVEISMKEILEQSILEQLAHCLEHAEHISHIPILGKNSYLLLPQQKGIYAVCSKNPDTLTYNMPARLLLPEDIDREKLKCSIQNVINHHKLLNSYIKLEGEEIVGVYANGTDFRFESWEEGQEEAFVRPFDLSKAPLIRIGFTKKEMLFDMHHIVADGESLNIILKDIASAYRGEELSEQTVSYSDYAEFFCQQDMSKHKNFFRKMLTCDFEPVALPETRMPETGGTSKIYTISETVVECAGNYAKRHNLTDTMVFLGAYGILLSKYSARTEILSSIVLQNRIHKDTKNVVGMFVNTLPFYLEIKGTLSEYMETVRRLMLALYEYQELPFPLIAEDVGMKDKSVVNTCFVYQTEGKKCMDIMGKQIVPNLWDTHEAKFDLTMELAPMDNQVKVRLEYDCAKYDEFLMDRLFETYVQILAQLEKKLIADINVMSDKEYDMVVEKFNDTFVDYPREKCVHELFTEQAEKTPDRVALVFEDQKFTYKELDEMSNSLAHFLREKGVQPNDVVPIIAKRSWHVIVAMLGVLKAGGAYMPVDPGYPVERIEYMLEESKSEIILVYEYQIKNNMPVIDLSQFDFEKETESILNLNSSRDLCYVLFTSGSTGRPKAVLVNHANLGNFINDNKKNSYQSAMLKNCNVVLADTAFTFDISVFEIYLALLHGLTIILTKDMANAMYLADLILNNDIDVIHITPTKLFMLLQDKRFQMAIAKIKMLMIGAEQFTQKLYEKIILHTSAIIYNGYGPTETTIGCSFKKILNAGKAQTDITIGKPIANTQIYILDKNNRPLSIGVAGELCIAGAGVGKGYLNRPELTAEKFVPNPFATEQNHHGAILYHTGDLARWRADGEIEYLGRIDTQVKIRGLRIELGEIESIMSSFAGIQLTAVADKRNENGRQYLVGYYTTADGNPVDEKELRRHLSAKLPKYMIPNYFMNLGQMPMTPSGKMARKNLPVPEFTAETDRYIAPETEVEKKLCRLLEDLLHMEKIGVEEDFFECGGDSLAAIEYVARAHNAGIEIGLQNVFDYPTVRTLCGFLSAGRTENVQYSPADFEPYAPILEQNVINPQFIPKKKDLGNVLLTGATGFLGAHVLDRLMREGTEKIYCLIRSSSIDDRRGRLQKILEYYFDDKYVDEIGKHIIPVVGNIEQEGLAEQMPSDVQTVIHTAASVKHYGSYAYFHKVNVEGTQHVIDYAKAVGAKLIHISTLSVSGNSMADDFSVYRSEEEKHFYETSLYIEQPLDNVYIHSKFEAEKRVFDAMLDGLEAKVIRVGNLTNRASDYKFQPNYKENAFLTRVKAILEFGLFPDYLMDLYAEFSPIDKTAEGIVKIAQYADRQTVFHLNSNRVLYFDRFLEVVHTLGIPMKVVDGKTFNHALQNTLKTQGTEYIFEAFQNDMDESGRLVYDSNIHIENEFTLWFLKQTGFEWNETDLEYIRGYVNYFREIGYLEVRNEE